jgi:hypothetical protein
MDEKVLPLNQVSCDPSWWTEECQAQQTFFKWISKEIVSLMLPQRDMYSTLWMVFHTACCESVFFPPQNCCFPWRFNTKAVSKLHFHCLHGVVGLRSFIKPDHCHQPLFNGIRTLINSHVWNSTVHCKVITWLPTPTNPRLPTPVTCHLTGITLAGTQILMKYRGGMPTSRPPCMYKLNSYTTVHFATLCTHFYKTFVLIHFHSYKQRHIVFMLGKAPDSHSECSEFDLYANFSIHILCHLWECKEYWPITA